MRAGRAPGNDEGFTLIEVMAAMAVFLVVSAATLAVIMSSITTIRGNSDRVFAANLAREEIDKMRELGPDAITIGQVSRTVSSTEGSFTVSTTSNWVGLNQTANACSAGVPGQAFMRVHVEVSGGRLQAPQLSDTVVAPLDDSTYATTGAVAVQVNDARGDPVGNVIVSGRDLAGGTTFSYVTGPDGCIFVPRLAPSNSWQVTVSRTGFVPQGTGGTVQVGTVTAGGTTPMTFNYAQAASLNFTTSIPAYPIPSGVPLTMGTSPTGTSALPVTAYPKVIGSLWPALTGYVAWLGTCTDADPASATTPRTTSVPRQWFVPDAGETLTAELDGAEVKIRGLLADAVVSIRHAAEAAGQCTSAVTYTAGRTDKYGVLTALLPWGKWTVSASGVSSKDIILDPATAATTVSFTQANLDIPCPTASPTPSPTPTSTAGSLMSPAPTATPTPTPTATPLPCMTASP